MEVIPSDLRYAWRTLWKNPGTTGVAIGILAMTIGANASLFALMNAVLLRPLPGVASPGELVRFIRLQNGEYSNLSYPDYVDYRDRNRSFAGVAAEREIPMSYAHGTTERVAAAVVTGTYFGVFEVNAAVGRLLGPADDRIPGAHSVAVISHRFWMRDLAGDPGVIGRKLLLNGYPYEVVGVASQSFSGARIGGSTDVWLPIMMQQLAMSRYDHSFLPLRSAGWLSIYARLRHGIALHAASLDIQAIAQDLERTYPETNRGRSVKLSAGVGLDPDERRSLAVLFQYLLASVGLLLLIACANLANVFLTRAVQRRREIAVRLALGVRPARLFRQLILECLLVCAAASALGLVLTPFATEAALTLLQPADPAFRTAITIDARVVGFTIFLAAITSLFCGLAPALQALKTDIVSTLKSSSQAGPLPRRGFQLRHILVLAQVALAFAMLVGGGLLLRTMREIRAIDTGFSSKRVLLAAVDLSLQRYTEPAGKEFCEHLVRRLNAVHGVESVSISKSEPARDWSDRRPIFHPGQEPPANGSFSDAPGGITVDANRITPGYFQSLGMPLAAGRDFTWRDRTGSQPVCIVSERLAHRMWPGESALGKRIAVPAVAQPGRPPLEVVGVTRDSRYRSLLAEPPLLLYEPLLQAFDTALSIELRTTGEPAPFARVVSGEVAAIDPNLAVYNVRTFADQVDGSLWERRAAATLVGTFSVLALSLAVIGLYASLAYSVSRCRRDIAIRMALGAAPNRVLGSVMRDASALAFAGVALGAIGCLPLSRLGSSFLFGVSSFDLTTWVAVATAVPAIMLAASYSTAKCATAIDPAEVLRDS